MAERTCIECGKTIDQAAHRSRKYCSNACANRRFAKAWRKKNRVRQDEYFDRTCVMCSAAFRSSRPTGKYCSDECKGQHYRETKRIKCVLPDDHPSSCRSRPRR